MHRAVCSVLSGAREKHKLPSPPSRDDTERGMQHSWLCALGNLTVVTPAIHRDKLHSGKRGMRLICSTLLS